MTVFWAGTRRAGKDVFRDSGQAGRMAANAGRGKPRPYKVGNDLTSSMIIRRGGVRGTSQAAEKFVEFVGGVEVRFQFARVQALANIVEASREQIERR